MVGAGETRCELLMGILDSPLGKGVFPVSHRVYRQVVSHRGDGLRGLPVKGEVHRRETFRQGPRAVMCLVGRKGVEGCVEARCHWVYLQRGANNPKPRQSLSLGDLEGDHGEARFHRGDPGGGS